MNDRKKSISFSRRSALLLTSLAALGGVACGSDDGASSGKPESPAQPASPGAQTPAPNPPATGGTDGAGGTVAKQSQYLVSVREWVAGSEDLMSYFFTVPSLDGAVNYDLKKAQEAGFQGWIIGKELSPTFWIASQDEATIAKWTVGADGKFEKGAVLDFTGYGLFRTGYQAKNGAFVSPDRHYFVAYEGDVIVWNPEKMELVKKIPVGIADDGNLGAWSSLVKQGTDVLVTTFYVDNDDATKFGRKVRTAKIDTKTDTVSAPVESTRAQIAIPNSTSSNGTIYYGGRSTDGMVRAIYGAPSGYASQALRIVPAGTDFEATFNVNLSALVGGRPVGAFRLLNDQTALLDVWHPEEVTPVLADKSNADKVQIEKGYHTYKWTVGAPAAEKLPGEAYAQGLLDLTSSFATDGRLFGSELTEDPKTLTNSTYEITSTGARRLVFTGAGQVLGLLRVR